MAIWRWLLVFLVSFFALNVAFGQAGQPASGIQRVQVPSQDRAGGQPVMLDGWWYAASAPGPVPVVLMLHGTALASVVTLHDLTGVAREVNSIHYLPFEAFITAATTVVTVPVGTRIRWIVLPFTYVM